MNAGGRSALFKVGPNDAGPNHELCRGQIDNDKERKPAELRGLLMISILGPRVGTVKRTRRPEG
jgi:hypothetical protein